MRRNPPSAPPAPSWLRGVGGTSAQRFRTKQADMTSGQRAASCQTEHIAELLVWRARRFKERRSHRRTLSSAAAGSATKTAGIFRENGNYTSNAPELQQLPATEDDKAWLEPSPEPKLHPLT